MGGYACMGLGCVKFGMGWRHFKASCNIASGK
jgi:hypothetical protein